MSGVFEHAFAGLAERFRMEWSLLDRERRPRVAILVSKTHHCLYELLLKHQDGELDCDIPIIVSNHPTSPRSPPSSTSLSSR